MGWVGKTDRGEMLEDVISIAFESDISEPIVVSRIMLVLIVVVVMVVMMMMMMQSRIIIHLVLSKPRVVSPHILFLLLQGR